jgi:MFS family permease
VRDFRIFWIGALVSNTGGWMQRVTVPFVLFEMTGSAAWVGFAAFAQFIPVVVLGPIGGSLADRFSRRNLLIATQSIQAVLSFVLWGLWMADLAEAWVIVVIVVGVGAAFGLNGPAWQAFVSELVPRELLLNAVTLNSTQFNASRAVGPAIGGVVLATMGAGGAFLINALSFAAVLGALFMIASRPPQEASTARAQPFREFGRAIRYASGVPGIVAAYVVVFALGLLCGPLANFVVVFTDEVFEVGDVLYGILGAAFGVGAIAVAPLVAGRGSGIARSRLTLWSVFGSGGSLVAFALAPDYWLAVAATLVGGAAWLAIASTLNTTIQVQVDETMRGKVLAAYLMLLTLAIPVGSLVQGWLVEVVGARATVAGAGGLFCLVGVVLLVGNDLLSHMDDDPVAVTRPTEPSGGATAV